MTDRSRRLGGIRFAEDIERRTPSLTRRVTGALTRLVPTRNAPSAAESRHWANAPSPWSWTGCVLTVLLLFALAGASTTSAQETAPEEADIQILDAKWGFDGFSRYKTFVPLRIVMKNRSSELKTIKLQLTRADALNDQGEVLEQEVTINTDTTRVVVMSPFVSDPGEMWTLHWGEGEDESLPIKAQSADDGIVFITSTADLIHRSGSLPIMNEDEFPTSVTALDALRVVFLDQEPRWPGARRKAFQEWLLKGGQVVVLDLPDGSTPKFANGFEYLNVTQPSTPYGSGTIQRLTLSPQQVTKKIIETKILGRPLTGGDLKQKLAAYEATRWGGYRNPALTADGTPILSYSRDAVLTELKDLAGTRQRWGLIYLTVFVYVGWQWRTGWRWGLMEKQPGRFYGWLVGLSLGFSLLFFAFGRVGAAGENRVRSVMIARRVTNGLYDVEGWSAVATGLTGGEHAFSVPGSGQLYGGTESYGQNSMQIRDGKMTVDLSAYSTQKVAFRTRVEMPDIPLRLDSASVDLLQMESKSAQIVIDPSYKAPLYAAVIVIDNHIYEYTGKTGELKPTESWGHSMHDWISPYTLRNAKRMQWRTSLLGWLFDTRTSDDIYTEAFVSSVGNGFSVGPTVFPDSFALPHGYARVMLYTDLPKELRLSGDFPDQGGRMLYVTDVPLSGGR